MSEILRLENVTTGYNDHPVLRNISVSVRRGEVLGIIGQNGSGKSTLLKTIARIISDNSGSIIINDVKIDRLQPWELREHGVAYSMQVGNIFPTLTVDQHFTLVLTQTSQEDASSIRETCLGYFPDLKQLASRRAGNLSGGQRQMLGFAMLFCQQASIWLLDEPMAGLAQNAVELSVEFLQEMKAQGLTIILVEHNYPAAFKLADQVCIAQTDRIVGPFSREIFQEANFLDDRLFN